ncbi:helix-turn-helix domain-containing protein [Paenibacillus cremeus]|uniref:Helix-turn-helix transcriptional regulator n=1 Tax=Paenibacillus cremeus TaxID=2163881 RepID=A0A559K4H8_9BACL|nr:helix-turn-helix transcriptional regulator [Paenibacillus cremeus]TVY07045.1 helix-turn-helix transcriptional regulator [Paenibacillus cremeus]
MDKAVLKSVGSRIRDLRKQKDLSQEELGEIAGFHFSYIGGVERAEKNISLINLQKIADGLCVPIHELFLFTKRVRTSNTEKDILLNQIHEQLIEMQLSDLKKIQLLITQLFQNK